MNIAKLTMPPRRAREEFLRYKHALSNRGGTEQDRLVMEGYRQMSRGKMIVELQSVMTAAGVDAQAQPKLAVCRADAKWCYFRYEWGFNGLIPKFTMVSNRGRESPDVGMRKLVNFEFAAGTWPVRMSHEQRNQYRRWAIVPTIPPQLRPRAAALCQHVILWEAEWQTAPVDPILLRPIGGTLYAVVAQWDLTELERAVLAGTM